MVIVVYDHDLSMQYKSVVEVWWVDELLCPWCLMMESRPTGI